MSCGDGQSAGTYITNIQDNNWTEGNAKPVFDKYTRLQQGVLRYNKNGNYWQCSDFYYYNLDSHFSIVGNEVSSKDTKIAIQSKAETVKDSVNYISYMGADCNNAYNSGSFLSVLVSWARTLIPFSRTMIRMVSAISFFIAFNRLIYLTGMQCLQTL